MSLLKGYATRRGMGHYRDTHLRGRDHFCEREGLYFSTVGIGTYLGEASDEVDDLYFEAIKVAIVEGCNVIDTALNYRGMRSERIIGRALRALSKEHSHIREGLIISSKSGFIPVDGERCKSPVKDRLFLERGVIDQEDIEFGHSINPEFIRESLELSLENLQLETIDIYFLHNPETQLERWTPEEFYGSLREAFQCLEDLVREGKLRMYGAATWSGYRADCNAPDYLSLERVRKAAQTTTAGKNHHFRVIQLPISLLMPEAYLKRNQRFRGKWYTTLELAERLGLVVFSSRTIDKGREYPGISIAKRIQAIRSLRGVTSCLVGMKNPEHVKENLRVVGLGKMPPSELKEAMTIGS